MCGLHIAFCLLYTHSCEWPCIKLAFDPITIWCIRFLFFYTSLCVYIIRKFKQQRASVTSEAAIRQRNAGWKLNDNEYVQGDRDYATAEMETQKSQDYWAGCLHGTLLLPGCVYVELNLPCPWGCLIGRKRVVNDRQMTCSLLALLFFHPAYYNASF